MPYPSCHNIVQSIHLFSDLLKHRDDGRQDDSVSLYSDENTAVQLGSGISACRRTVLQTVINHKPYRMPDLAAESGPLCLP